MATEYIGLPGELVAKVKEVAAKEEITPEDRHLRLLTAGGACIFISDTIHPGAPLNGRQLCALPMSKLADISRNKVAHNTLAMGAALSMAGVGFESLESVLVAQFGRKGAAVVKENVDLARVGYENFRIESPFVQLGP